MRLRAKRSQRDVPGCDIMLVVRFVAVWLRFNMPSQA